MTSEPSPWEKYKQNLGETRPWDFLNPATEYANDEEATSRFDICKACPELIKLTNQCNICKCFMVAKTKLAKATCPLHKW